MPAGGSGYANLVLTGDWTRTSWNVGCIEAAAESGVNAAAAVAAAIGGDPVPDVKPPPSPDGERPGCLGRFLRLIPFR